MMTEKQNGMLFVSNNQKDWLLAFEQRAELAVEEKLTIRELFTDLVMMGPLPWNTNTEYWTGEYDRRVYTILDDRDLIPRLRREALRDFQRPEPLMGEVCETKHAVADKHYCLVLLTWFLKDRLPLQQ